MAVLQNAYIVVVAALLYLKMSMKAQCFNFHFKRRQMHTKKSFLIWIQVLVIIDVLQKYIGVIVCCCFLNK